MSDAQLPEALLQLNENMRPVIEACEGQREMMKQRGWSAESADRYACELLLGMTRTMFAGAARQT